MIENLIQSDVKPRYMAIVRGVENAIVQQLLRPGEKLPPQRELAHRMGIAVATVGRAYAELEERGFVKSHVGRGTHVVGSNNQLKGTMADNQGHIDMSTYRVPVAQLPGLVSGTLRDIADSDASRVMLDATPAHGALEHREAMAQWLDAHGISAVPDQIVITNGGQHATMAAISTMTHPGQVIATEHLTDPRMKAVSGYLDRHLAGVEADDDGMIPEALEQMFASRRIAAIYCTPRNQNPTNSVMPLIRRQAIADIADRHDVPIIESDIYGTLRKDPIAPIFALAPKRTHFVSSLGRIAGPGMKVGCLVSPTDSVARSRQGVSMSTGAATRLQAEVAARWIQQNRIKDMVQWQRAETQKRVTLLANYTFLSDAIVRPTSPHVWLTLPEPWRGEEFVEAAAAHGVSIAPTHSFVVGRREVPHAVRLVIGGPKSLQELERGLGLLEKLLQTQPRPHGRSDSL